jgi:hypothetical protein
MKSFDGFKHSPHCGKCWKLDHPASFCNRYKMQVVARRSNVSRALDVFDKLPICLEGQKKRE